jgi:hypothetical protein
MRTVLCSVLLLCVLVQPAGAQDQPPSAPHWVAEFADDVRLGVRVEGGVLHSRLSIAPLEERGLRYLNRPVDSEIAPVTTPLYGVSAGLRWEERAELLAAYRLNNGVTSEAALQFQSGERAIPSAYDVRQWEVRMHYFVLDNVGVGLLYHGEQGLLDRVRSFTIMETEVTANIFSVSSRRRSLSLYVPVRVPLGNQTTFFGQIGGSIYGMSDDIYTTRFTFYQDPDTPDEIFPVPPNDENAFIEVGRVNLNRQFLRLGLERPFYGVTARLFFLARRVSVGEVSEEWRVGARVQIGLPF